MKRITTLVAFCFLLLANAQNPKWDFEGGTTQGWAAFGGITGGLTVNSGVLTIVPNGTNFPTIDYTTAIGGIVADGITYKYMRISMRNQSNYNQVRFREPVGPTTTTPQTIAAGQLGTDGFQDYYIDLTAFAAWDSASEDLFQIRFSKTPAGGGDNNVIEIDEIELFAATTWDGSAWTNGLPDINKYAIIGNGSCTLTVDTEAYKLTVQDGTTLNIASGRTLTIDKNIEVLGAGSLVFRTNSSLLQNDATVTNIGNIEYRRNSTPMIQFDYTYWGSPVSNQVLNVFSPLTLSDKYFTYDSFGNQWVQENPTNTMQPGVGYAIRAPQGYGSTGTQYNGIYIGSPNNGDINASVNIYDPVTGNYNLLGNPYPSAIDTRTLIDNSSIETIYYWTHNTAVSSNQFTANDYAVRTRLAGTTAASGGVTPGRYMSAGQGFFSRNTAAGTVTFTNAMRVLGSNSQFFRASNTVSNEEDDNLIRLDLSNTGGAFKQQVLIYFTGATDGYDSGLDGDQIDGQYVSFYSIIPNHELAINVKAMPWSIDDQVPLGFKSTITGVTSFDISISELGVFFTDKDVFLEDKVTNTFHDLKSSTYTFTSDAGVFTNRFVIHYKDLSLKADTFTSIENQVLLFQEASNTKITSRDVKIKSVKVYDTLGRLVFSNDNVDNNELVLYDLKANNQTLLFNVTLENNIVVKKKYIL